MAQCLLELLLNIFFHEYISGATVLTVTDSSAVYQFKQMFQTIPMDFPLSGFKGLISWGLMLHYIITHVLKVLVNLHFLWIPLHQHMKRTYYLNTV